MQERRHIPLEGGSNLRDIGGYRTDDGRQVRWGLIYRSGALGKLTPSDWKLIADRHIVTVCDLRAHEERAAAPTLWQGGTAARQIGSGYPMDTLFDAFEEWHMDTAAMSAALYPYFPMVLAKPYSAFFAALVAGHVPLIVHCSAGQDRTGIAIGLLLTALGVRREAIIEDYHLSTKLRAVKNEIDREALGRSATSERAAHFLSVAGQSINGGRGQPHPLFNPAGGSLLLDALAAVEQRWGTVGAYLAEELGISPVDVERLKERYLKPAAPVTAPKG